MSKFTQCDLSFVCRQSWENLQETDSSYVRYCGECSKGVFSVHTREQLELASALGRCAALTDDNEIVGWIGESNFDWMAEETETVAVRSLQAIDAETANRLRMAFPKVVSAEKAYVTGMWITIGTFSPQMAASLERDIRAQFSDMEIQNRRE